MSRRIWSFIALAVILALALAACGGGGKTAAPATESTAATTPEESDLSLQSRDTGLDKLTSYRLTWHAEWTSTDQGKTENGTWDWIEEYTAEPKAHHLSMKSPDTNDPAKINTFEIWQIGDTTYIKSGDDQKCTSLSSESAASSMEKGIFNPSMLGSIQDATYLGRDTINGVPAKHYKYSSKAGTVAGLGVTSGETWVAIDGGYVVKDVVKWKGGGGLFGLRSSTTETGEGTWTWELSDANQPFEIKQAEDCQAATALDLPIMPDATEKSQYGEMVTYKTASKVADVAAFYQEKLPEAGWAVEGEPNVTDDTTMINYTKDGKTLSVIINVSDGATQVILNIGE